MHVVVVCSENDTFDSMPPLVVVKVHVLDAVTETMIDVA